jgi:hypothetical protein
VSSTKRLHNVVVEDLFGISWTVMTPGNELKTGLWTVHCPKKGKLPGLGYSYPPKPSPVKWRDALNPSTDLQALMIYYTK